MVDQMEVHPLNQQIELKKWMDKYEIRLEAWAPFGEGRNSLFENEVLKKSVKNMVRQQLRSCFAGTFREALS